MFKNCGKTIKIFAFFYFGGCIGIAIILLLAGFAEMVEYASEGLRILSYATFLNSLKIFCVGFFGAPFIYGFGEIIGCLKAIRDKE